MSDANGAGGGKRLKVLASGLHQLGISCEKIAGELAAEAAAPLSIAASGWASSAATVSAAATASGMDLRAVAHRIGTSGANYTKAGTVYSETDEGSAGEFRGLTD